MTDVRQMQHMLAWQYKTGCTFKMYCRACCAVLAGQELGLVQQLAGLYCLVSIAAAQMAACFGRVFSKRCAKMFSHFYALEELYYVHHYP